VVYLHKEVQLSKINQEFYNIVNNEDWDELSTEELDPTIETMLVADGDMPGDFPVGQVVVPTPIPGVWIRLNIGLDVEEPGDF